MYYEEEFIDTKLRSNNRTLVLKPVDGKKAASSTGLVDPRLFTGGNNLHAIKMPPYGLWAFKYDSGGLPEPLKQKFTSFKALFDFAKVYFLKRNLEIVEIKD